MSCISFLFHVVSDQHHLLDSQSTSMRKAEVFFFAYFLGCGGNELKDYLTILKNSLYILQKQVKILVIAGNNIVW